MSHTQAARVIPFVVLAVAATGSSAAAQSWRIVAADPEARAFHAIAWDPVNGRLLSFGGQTAPFIVSSTTAHRVGTRWNVLPVASPTARMGHAMATDPLHGRILLIGGFSPLAGPVLGIHEWDGTTWNAVGLGGPQPGSSFVASGHARSGGVMLYGAGNGNETWTWDGQQWTLRQPALNPGQRTGSGIAYDQNRDVVVLFGGRNGIPVLGGTFEWDGTNWTAVQPAVEPPPDAAPIMAFDPLRNRTVLVTSTVETWEFDGSTWTHRNPAHRPSQRTNPAMAFDFVRSRILLDGGAVGSTSTSTILGDAWEWDGVDWVQVASAEAPLNRATGGLVDDPATGDVLAFEVGYRWRLHGGVWTGESLAGAQPFTSTTELAGDQTRGNVLAFPGGSTGSGTMTWTFAGGQWSARTPAQQPANRAAHAMACDSVRGRVVLFGGFGGGGVGNLQDTWEWDGANWTQIGGTMPPGRNSHAMAEDLAGGGVLMFGGYSTGSMPGDTWRYTAAGWQQVATSGPRPRFLHALAKDVVRSRVVLVGGLTQPPNIAPSDHWEWDGTQWTQIGRVPESVDWRLASSRRGAVLVMDRLTMEFGGPSATAATYGAGCATAASPPRLAAGGLPELGTQRFEIVLDRSTGPGFAVVLGSTSATNIVIGPCVQLVANPMTLLSGITASNGLLQWELAIPDRVSLRGLRVYMQGAVLQPNGALLGAASLTNGIDLRLDR